MQPARLNFRHSPTVLLRTAAQSTNSAEPKAGVQVAASTALAITALTAVFLGGLTGNWLASVSLLVLWAIWWGLPNQDGLHVLAFALSFQWLQVTAGIFYFLLTGRAIKAMTASPYQPMVLIGLGCVVSLIVGLRLGVWGFRKAVAARPPKVGMGEIPIRTTTLLVIYLCSLAFEGTIAHAAYTVPAITQAILVFRYVHLGGLFLLLRRLSRTHTQWLGIAALLALETALGLTGFFAGFREPLIIAAVVMAGSFDVRSMHHWAVAVVLALTLGTISLVWMSVRTEYRQDYRRPQMSSREARFDRITTLSSEWWQSSADEMLDDLDFLVDRIWAVYYPALAVSRVPLVLPHTDGAILKQAILHALEPRVLFPDKAALRSDSVMVRRYSGIPVAGPEQNTSIAFGYAAEGYLDFGVPGMFVPVLLWGVFLGAAYGWFLRAIAYRELALAVVAVIFWLSLYLFERSWAMTIGFTGTMMIYFGGAVVIADRYLRTWQAHRASMPIASGPPPRFEPRR
jgi:hypothetical protein